MTNRRRARPIERLALLLSLFMALPAIEWCPFSWSECDVACASSPSCSGPSRCGVAPTAAAPIPQGDRAWCVHRPLEGLLARDVELTQPAATATLAEWFERESLEAPRITAVAWERRPLSVPVRLRPHAPPLARAPPGV
ncbi:MAG: hypothetical protein HOP12_02755 [Candidatus Eisenbacteria bacterium]|uniref:Uncharacterized protein n=1 Tax=Eiseniibacteriota bacterium TaxID=2212470 RepID=A0A849SNT4_UNCEI|nr:hypothetical protein [Candidatus Eisenbacteria bacterium]